MKKTKQIIKNLILTSLCLVLVLSSLLLNVSAREMVDLSKKGSLSIEYKADRPMVDVGYRIYKIADISENGEYTITDDFKQLAIVFPERESGETYAAFTKRWQDLANTLKTQIPASNKPIDPDARARTDSNSIATFTDVDLGMYLVIGEDVTFSYDDQDKKIKYAQLPFIVSIPTDNRDTWVYDISAKAKWEKVDPKLVDRKALKIWVDAGNKSKRPDKIEVSLLKDGAVYQTVSLNKDNGWSYRWNNLSSEHDWRVVEKTVPSGYAVRYSKTGITLEIINEYTTTTKKTTTTTRPYYTTGTKTRTTTKTTTSGTNTTTSGSNTTTSVETTTATTNPDEDIPGDSVPRGNETTVPGNPDEDIPEEEIPEDIPQAGMLWWPVPVLLVAGIAIFIMGLIKKNKA